MILLIRRLDLLPSDTHELHAALTRTNQRGEDGLNHLFYTRCHIPVSREIWPATPPRSLRAPAVPSTVSDLDRKTVNRRKRRQQSELRDPSPRSCQDARVSPEHSITPGGTAKSCLTVFPVCERPRPEALPVRPTTYVRAQSYTGPEADFWILYSTLSTRASQLASMTLAETPTVPQSDCLSRDSITTRTRAAVPSRALTTRTL
jgi:hypothetical protein